MHKRISLIITTALVLLMNSLNAQSIEMADVMRSEGKIYVVVVVVLIIFIGLSLYLFSIDKKVSKFEKKDQK